MASPQPDKYIRMSTELVDKLCRYRLSGQEWQALWVIIRKTWGWHKKMDRISLGQISESTQIPRRKVFMLIKQLENKKIIIKAVPNKGDIRYISYGIQKDYDKWVGVPKKGAVPNKGDKVSPKKATRVSPKKVHTIDTLKDILKDNIVITQQIDNLLTQFSSILQEKIKVYISRVALKNKSKVISDGRKLTLLTELFNAKERCANDDIFGYALDMSINYDACCIGYMNAIIRNKMTEKSK